MATAKVRAVGREAGLRRAIGSCSTGTAAGSTAGELPRSTRAGVSDTRAGVSDTRAGASDTRDSFARIFGSIDGALSEGVQFRFGGATPRQQQFSWRFHRGLSFISVLSAFLA